MGLLLTYSNIQQGNVTLIIGYLRKEFGINSFFIMQKI